MDTNTQHKDIISSEAARSATISVVTLLADIVGITLGPKGRTVLISNGRGEVHVTKDGLTVVNAFTIADPIQSMIIETFKEIVKAMPGDGTTTATILAKNIYLYGIKMITAGHSIVHIKQGINIGKTAIINKLREMSEPVNSYKKLVQVASVSSNNDLEIGTIVADALQYSGVDGKITVKEGNTVVMPKPEFKNGFSLDRGYISGYFVNDTKGERVILENPYVLIYDKKITTSKQIANILSLVSQAGRSLVVIAEDIDGDALATMVINKMRGLANVCAIKAPGFGDTKNAILHDLALYLGCKVISADIGDNIENIDLDSLGKVGSVISDKTTTVCIDGAGDPDKINERKEFLRQKIASAKNKYDKEQYEERLSQLSGKICVIKVGAATEVEIKEKKDRIDDAHHATRAALLGGVLPGGGAAFLRCLNTLKEIKAKEKHDGIKAGLTVIYQSIQEPTKVIAKNAGEDGDVIINRILDVQDYKFGYNVLSESIENLIETGIIDPTNVTVSAIENACSCAVLLLSTEAMIASSNNA